MSTSPFIYNADDYVRQLDFFSEYVEQCALYAARVLKKPLDYCKRIILHELSSEGKHPFKDKMVSYLQRMKNGDREKREIGFLNYIQHIKDKELICAPTFTVYLNPRQRKSFLAEFIAIGKAERKVAKNRMFDFKELKDYVQADFWNNIQNNKKVVNNSLSGAQSSPSNAIYNKSAHSTLTSTCRISTSYANANNEWFLAGNRHYWAPQVVLAHLLTHTRHTDFTLAEQAIHHYELHIPTPAEVITTIKHSSELYWSSDKGDRIISDFVHQMTDVERATFVYGNDLYHLSKYNDAFTRELLGSMAHRPSQGLDNPKEALDMLSGDQIILTTLICSSLLKGDSIKSAKTKNPEAYSIAGAVAQNFINKLQHYDLFIRAFWRPQFLPSSIANLPRIIRKVVATSDTDSTIFSNQYWVQWFCKDGDYFGDTANAVGAVTTYVVSQLVKHRLAMMSKNLGVDTSMLFAISMKNEYRYLLYALTPVAKHYFALKAAQEGKLLDHLEMENKGVHLRDSTAPKEVTKLLGRYQRYLMESVLTGRKLRIEEIYDTPARLEMDIKDDIESGRYRYLKSLEIKDSDSYVAKEDATAYKNHLFWVSVFGKDYGEPAELPYPAMKISTRIRNKTMLRDWVSRISTYNRELALRLQSWIEDQNKSNISTIYIPLSVIQTVGIPREIADIVDVRKVVSNLISPFYMVMESLGFYIMNKHRTRLLSDWYKPKDPLLLET